MKFKIDHDLHIHSFLSRCSKDPCQTTAAILDYAEKNNMNTVCITDHYWDSLVDGASEWYSKQNFDHISQSKPLPQSNTCKFLFGCETDMDKNFKLGIPNSRYDDFDFIIVPTTHLHMKNFTFEESCDNVESKTNLYIKRFEAFLNSDLPFKKTGLAHITCSLIHRENNGYIQVLNNVSDAAFETLFRGCAKRGCGVELNLSINELTDSELTPSILRPYIIAKKQGCKFYLGGDAHTVSNLENTIPRFQKTIDLLSLDESDKFIIEV